MVSGVRFRRACFCATAVSASLALTAGAAAATPSKSSWARAANSICARADAEVRMLPTPTSKRILIADIRAMAAIATRAYADLAAIPVPRSERHQVELLVAVGRRGTSLSVHQLVSAVQRNDSTAARRLERRLTESESRYNATARALGARVCAENPAPSG